MPTLKGARGYHPNLDWNANGLLSLYPLGVVGTATLAALFDGERFSNTNCRMENLLVNQRTIGGGGTTTVELYRRRAGVFTLITSAGFGVGGGDYSQGSGAIATEPLRELLSNDRLYVQFTAVQTTTAADVTVEVIFS